MQNRLYIFIVAAAISVCGMAQTKNPVFKDASDYKPLKHMKIGATAGTTGLGIDVATPINKNINIRAGFSVMPKISVNKAYTMGMYGGDHPATDEAEANRRVTHLCSCLKGMLNFPPLRDENGEILRDDNGDILYPEEYDKVIDESINMSHQISFYNAKLLVDWYPFKKKNWHFTVGAYYGCKEIGRAINTSEESSTLVAINQYNAMYDQIQGLEEFEYPSFIFSKYSFELDPIVGEQVIGAFNWYGRIAVQLGEFSDGTGNYVTPNKYGVLEAHAKTNPFKFYLGTGWSTNIGYDKRWSIGFDAGALIWGGAPHVYCENVDGKNVCLVHDVKNIGGAVGKYIKLIKKFPVYPNIEIRLAYTIF